MTTASWIVAGFGLLAALFGAFIVWSASPRRSEL